MVRPRKDLGGCNAQFANRKKNSTFVQLFCPSREKSSYNVLICCDFSAHCFVRARRLIIKLPVVLVVKRQHNNAAPAGSVDFPSSRRRDVRLRDSQLGAACVARHRRPGDTKHARFASQQYNHPGRFRPNNLPDTADYLRLAAAASPPGVLRVLRGRLVSLIKTVRLIIPGEKARVCRVCMGATLTGCRIHRGTLPKLHVMG
jgi:hypothetical protein